MDIQAYLKRINQQKVINLDRAALAQLQMNHLLHVPFENLDVIHNVKIPLDVKMYYEKIVTDQRGGFCYELNGLFHWLLHSLGYTTHLIATTVKRGDGTWSMEGSHMALIVQLEQPYFVDVGFGDSARSPIPLTGDIHRDVSGTYRIIPIDHKMYEMQRMDQASQWTSKLRFHTDPKSLADFIEPCHYNQTSPRSHFTQRELATIATPEGRITFSHDNLTKTHRGKKEEIPVQLEDKPAILQKYFGIRLTPSPS